MKKLTKDIKKNNRKQSGLIMWCRKYRMQEYRVMVQKMFMDYNKMS
jgi:hypothetical protein